jgi:hypothetical protein
MAFEFEVVVDGRLDGGGYCQTKADEPQKSGHAGFCIQELTPLGECFIAEVFEARSALQRSIVI